MHLEVAVQSGLVHGQVRSRGVHLVLVDIRFVGGYIGLCCGQLRLLSGHLRHNLLLIELGQLLALMDLVVDVHIELFHNARGLAFDLNLGDGLDLARSHHRTRHVAASHLGQLVRIDGRALDQMRQPKPQYQHNQNSGCNQPNPESFALT